MASAALRQPLALLKNLDDAGSPPLYQAALAAFLEEGHYHRHLHRSLRRGALIAALRDVFGDRARVLCFARLELDHFPEAVARLADAVAEVDGA